MVYQCTYYYSDCQTILWMMDFFLWRLDFPYMVKFLLHMVTSATEKKGFRILNRFNSNIFSKNSHSFYQNQVASVQRTLIPKWFKGNSVVGIIFKNNGKSNVWHNGGCLNYSQLPKKRSCYSYSKINRTLIVGLSLQTNHGCTTRHLRSKDMSNNRLLAMSLHKNCRFCDRGSFGDYRLKTELQEKHG